MRAPRSTSWQEHKDREGLYVIGPGTWQRLISGVQRGHGWVPEARDLGALPPPTEVCGECPIR